MQTEIFSLSHLDGNGRNFSKYLALRYSHFVRDLGWSVPHANDCELDQYDNLNARYVLITHRGDVIAGARAVASSAQWMQWSYMIGDAQKGLLPGIPKNALPVINPSIETWECTRLVVSPGCAAGERSNALKLVVKGLCDVAYSEGGKTLVSLSPLTMQRMLRSLGYDPSSIGRTFTGDEDGRKYGVFSMPIPERNEDDHNDQDILASAG